MDKANQIYNDFIDMIRPLILHKAILTIAHMNGAQKWDVKKVNGKLKFGTSPYHNLFFPLWFTNRLSESGVLSIILRVFTDTKVEAYIHETHKVINIPIKKVYGFFIDINHGIKQLSLQELIDSCCTDYQTGKPLPLEDYVIYCGFDGEYATPIGT